MIGFVAEWEVLNECRKTYRLGCDAGSHSSKEPPGLGEACFAYEKIT
jgi:hypothetical protein